MADLKDMLAQAVGGIKAYHGSPHDFDRFDSRFRNTGEGAQAFGQGHYFAEEPDVGRAYRDTVLRAKGGTPDMKIGDTPVDKFYSDLEQSLAKMPIDEAQEGYNRLALLEDLMHGGDVAHVRDNAAQDAYSPEVVDWFEREIAPRFTRNGRLYEVNINADPSRFIDWDNPISDELLNLAIERHGGREALLTKHAAADAAATRYLADEPGALEEFDALRRDPAARLGSELAALDKGKNQFGYDPREKLTGERFLHIFGRGEDASKAMRDMGVPGIKYDDAVSRGLMGDQARTKNYVVFDDSLIDIARKYGIPLAVAPGAAGALLAAGGGEAEAGESWDPNAPPEAPKTLPAGPPLRSTAEQYGVATGAMTSRDPDWREMTTDALNYVLPGEGKLGYERAAGVTNLLDLGTPAGVPLAIDDTARAMDRGAYGDAALSSLGFLPFGKAAGAVLGMAGAGIAKKADDLWRVVPDDPAQLTAPGKDPEWFHRIGGAKLKTPISEMTSTTVPTSDLPPRVPFSPEQWKVGDVLMPLYGDKTIAGQTLTHINDEALPRPVRLEGGPDYGRENPGALWAGNKSPQTTMMKRVADASDEGKRDVYGVHVAMGPRGGDFSRQTTRPLLDMAKEAPMTRAGTKALDDVMREATGGDWPGIRKADDDWLARSVGDWRTALAKTMHLAEFQKAGAPDVASVRWAVTEPELRNRPLGTTGFSVGKFDPLAKSVPGGHGDYPFDAPGTYLGQLGFLPPELLWRDLLARKSHLTEPQLGRAFQMGDVRQVVDQELIDTLMQRRGGQAK